MSGFFKQTKQTSSDSTLTPNAGQFGWTLYESQSVSQIIGYVNEAKGYAVEAATSANNARTSAELALTYVNLAKEWAQKSELFAEESKDEADRSERYANQSVDIYNAFLNVAANQRIVETFDLIENQTVVDFTKIFADAAYVSVNGQRIDSTYLVKDLDYTVSNVSQITLKRRYPLGTKLSAIQDIKKDDSVPGVSESSSIFNRQFLNALVGVSFGNYAANGRTLTPRLVFEGVQYVPEYDSSEAVQFTAVPVKQGDGSLLIETNKGPRKFNRAVAEAVSQSTLPGVDPDLFGTGSQAFERAAEYAKTHGKYISLSAKDYSFSERPDLQGVPVVGSPGSSVKGYFKNPGKMTGFKYGDTVTGQTDLQAPRVFQLPPSNVDNKFVVQLAYSNLVHMVCTQNDGLAKYDTCIVMRSGNGGDSSPWEHIRSQQIYRGIAYALQGFSGIVSSGTVADFNATPTQAGFEGGDWKANFSTENMYLKCKRLTETGSYIEKTIDVDNTGHINVGFHTTTSGSSFSISVDGEVKATGSTRMDVRKPRFRSLKVYVGFQPTAKIRVSHTGTTGQTLTITGFNIHRPAEAMPEIEYDTYAIYYDQLATYSANAGAHDYAMRNDKVGSFFGSYHGGEKALVPAVWRVDGAEVTLTAAKPVVGRVIDLMENTRIHDIVDAKVYQRFDGNSRHTLSVQLEGTGGVPFEVEKLYLGMNGTYDAFSRVLYPVMADGISGSARPDFLLGMTNMVAQENPTTGQVVYTHCNMPEGLPSAKGGVFIKTLDEIGSNYQKVYFAWVYDSPMKIDKVSAQIVKVFC